MTGTADPVTTAARTLAADQATNRDVITRHLDSIRLRLETLERQAQEARRELGVVLALVEQAA